MPETMDVIVGCIVCVLLLILMLVGFVIWRILTLEPVQDLFEASGDVFRHTTERSAKWVLRLLGYTLLGILVVGLCCSLLNWILILIGVVEP